MATGRLREAGLGAAIGGVLLLAAAGAQAFQFDVWRSGMKVDKVIEAGEKKGVSVSLPGSLPFFGKKEPDELADTVEYRAKMKLLGYSSQVDFIFAPESRVLYSVKVAISVPMTGNKADLEVLADTVAKQLDAKYKNQVEIGPEGLTEALKDKLRDVKRRAWKSATDTVTMESSWTVGGEVIVTYVDEKLAEKAKVEDRRIREKRLERSGGGDKGKF